MTLSCPNNEIGGGIKSSYHLVPPPPHLGWIPMIKPIKCNTCSRELKEKEKPYKLTDYEDDVHMLLCRTCGLRIRAMFRRVDEAKPIGVVYSMSGIYSEERAHTLLGRECFSDTAK